MSESKIEQSQSKNKELSVTKSILSGSVTGAFEVLVDHPLWTIKTRLQKGDPFTVNPRVLYRGILPNAVSMTPITALQVGLNCLFQKWFFDNRYELSDAKKLTSSFFAGVGSALISCPTEMVMTHQKGSFFATGLRLANQSGWRYLYSGLLATMLREGKFTAFFLAVTPIFKSKIKNYQSNEYLASLIAGITAGIFATLATQGFDVIKTTQQSNATKSPGFFKTTQQIYGSQGIYGFYKGTIPRGLRVMSAVTLMSWMNEFMSDLLMNKTPEPIEPYAKKGL